MAATIVQRSSGAGTTESSALGAASLAINMPSTVGAGSGLIVCLVGYHGASTPTITNVRSNKDGTTNFSVAIALTRITQGPWLALYYLASTAGGASTTITVTMGGTTDEIRGICYEVSGHDPASFFNVGSTPNNGTANPATTSVTGVGANAQLGFALWASESGNNESITNSSSGWTLGGAGTNGSAELVNQIDGRAGTLGSTVSDSWTVTFPGPNWIAAAATFNASTATTSTRTATPNTVALQATSTRTGTPVTVSLSSTGQRAVPVSDGTRGGWSNQTGGTTNLWATVDDASPDDSDYVQSSQGPVNDALTMDFGALVTPLSGGRTLHYRYSKDAGTERIDLVVDLLEGTTVVQTWTHTDIPTSWTQADQNVTGAIGNYAALHIRLTANQV